MARHEAFQRYEEALARIDGQAQKARDEAKHKLHAELKTLREELHDELKNIRALQQRTR